MVMKFFFFFEIIDNELDRQVEKFEDEKNISIICLLYRVETIAEQKFSFINYVEIQRLFSRNVFSGSV